MTMVDRVTLLPDETAWKEDVAVCTLWSGVQVPETCLNKLIHFLNKAYFPILCSSFLILTLI